ncbi:hypothetical protein FSP39_001216 [Pinctada imbricata]|uniref:Uncharacterized protein n=1 Tax=Pinctada imbricata TaxID=66713 RepID=A0AA88XMJ8_PINIB|nr:hypothetical protein FSP39_001216 [Pinctada imbricata]
MFEYRNGYSRSPHGERIFVITGMENSKWSKVRSRLGPEEHGQAVAKSTRPPKHQVPRGKPYHQQVVQESVKSPDRRRNQAKRQSHNQTYSNSAFLGDKDEDKGSNDKGEQSEADDDFVIIESISENGNYPRDRKMKNAEGRERVTDTQNRDHSNNRLKSADERASRVYQTTTSNFDEESTDSGKLNNLGHQQTESEGRRKNNENINENKRADPAKRRAHQSHPNTLRNVVYYQNRFIVLDSNDGSHRGTRSPTNSSKKTLESPKTAMAEARSGSFSGDDEVETFSKVPKTTRSSRTRNFDMDASSVTMDSRGIEIILTDPENSSKNITSSEYKKKTWIKKLHRLLLDNRMKGKPPLEHPGNQEEYRVLKKVLNITFLTVGIVLFVAVVVTVTYAFIAGDQEDSKAEQNQGNVCIDTMCVF